MQYIFPRYIVIKENCLVAQKNIELEAPLKKDLYTYGCVAKILQILKIPDGTVKILVEETNRTIAKFR